MALFNIFGGRTLTLAELINVDEGRQQRSQSLSVRLDKVIHRIKEETLWDKIRSLFRRSKNKLNMYYTVLKFLVDSPSGNSYTVIIEFQPNADLGQVMGNKVRVYCSCPSFKFQSAYVLNKRGNLYRSPKIDVELGQALTEAPDVRKTKTSTACKHVFACVQWINSNINYLMSSI